MKRQATNPPCIADDFIETQDTPINAKRLPWLAERYLKGIAGRTTATTRQSYAARIKHFLTWASQFETISETDMAGFKDYLAATHLKVAHHKEVLLRVAQMFHWAKRTGIAKQDYALWLPIIKAPETVFEPVTREHIAAHLAACTSTSFAVRGRAMIACMAGGGLRLNEVIGLNLEDVRIEADDIATLIVRNGKGNKSRTVVISRRYGPYIKTWLTQRSALLATCNRTSSDGAQALFFSKKGLRISQDVIHDDQASNSPEVQL